ncbi:MAG: DUF2336 domain-containing protein [Alphaproteobacteria bacterium]|nr:DUF2336 domain-containing protein [Alphaproteobacteria bacterium]
MSEDSPSNARSAAPLSAADIGALLTNPTTEVRANLTARIAGSFAGRQLGEKERAIALDILRTMAADAEVMVREALADHVRHSPDLPKDLALSIAKDVDQVAAPFLKGTPVLADDDLIGLLEGASVDKIVAIAQREQVSERVSGAIIATDNLDAVSALAGNDGAALTDAHMSRMIDRFGSEERLNGALAGRESLPVGIAERLVTLVSDRLRVHILTHHAVSPDVASDLLADARERVTLSLADGVDDTVASLVRQLHSSQRLTPSIVLRAACIGDMTFVEEAFAALAGVSPDKAYVLLHDAGPLGLKALYQRTGLPQALFPAFRAAVDVTREMALDGEENDTERFAAKVLERVLTGDTLGSASVDTEYLLDQLKRLRAAMAGTRLRRVGLAATG